MSDLSLFYKSISTSVKNLQHLFLTNPNIPNIPTVTNLLTSPWHPEGMLGDVLSVRDVKICNRRNVSSFSYKSWHPCTNPRFVWDVMICQWRDIPYKSSNVTLTSLYNSWHLEEMLWIVWDVWWCLDAYIHYIFEKCN